MITGSFLSKNIFMLHPLVQKSDKQFGDAVRHCLTFRHPRLWHFVAFMSII
jgi:hypothetical protein